MPRLSNHQVAVRMGFDQTLQTVPIALEKAAQPSPPATLKRKGLVLATNRLPNGTSHASNAIFRLCHGPLAALPAPDQTLPVFICEA